MAGEPPLTQQDIEFFIDYYNMWAAVHENGNSPKSREDMRAFLANSSLSDTRKSYVITKVNTLVEAGYEGTSLAELSGPHIRFGRAEAALVERNISRVEGALTRLLQAIPAG
jgi:hypothetical protein